MTAANRKQRNNQGMALIVVLIVSICMALIFSAVQFFSRSEYSHLDRIMVAKTLDYLVRAGINVAEDKLQKGRWYGDSSVRGVHSISDFPVDFLKTAHITIYADDYVRDDPQKIGDYMYLMLDHIKVFVKADFRGESLFGYGKFVISPDPIMGGTSTDGVDPEFKILTAAPSTIKRMINIKYFRPSDLSGVPGFSSMADIGSRKALAAHIKADLDQFATNYAKNALHGKKIETSYDGTKPACTQAEIHQKLAALDPGSAGGGSINSLKNLFILENFKRFFMTTNWDIPIARKEGKIAATGIELKNVPKKDMTSNRAQAIAIIKGSGHPAVVKEGRDYWKSFSSSGGKSAAEDFLERRGFTSPPDIAPKEFAAKVGVIKTGNAYKYSWKCTKISNTPTGLAEYHLGSNYGGGGDSGAAMFVQFYNNPSQWQPNGGSLTYSGDGPNPVFSNYYMNDSAGNSLSVTSVLQFFMKFIDESGCTTPDGDGKNEGWWKMNIAPTGDPDSHKGSGSDSCCG